MSEEKKYKRLAAFLDSKDAVLGNLDFEDDEKESLDKMIYYWEQCSPQEIDSCSIINKTKEKQRLFDRRKKRLTLYKVCTIAACFLAFAIGIYQYYGDSSTIENLISMSQSMDQHIGDTKETTLMRGDEELLIKQDGSLQYDKEGILQVDSTVIKGVVSKSKTLAENAKSEFNKLFVPKGKRAKIQLSDGTVLRVNSNSKVIYPNHFTNSTREIYVEGEVYLEVAHDSSRPFIVTGNDFEVKVLGTKFNISNYKNASSASIVLVEGLVEVKDAEKYRVKLSPNELLTIKGGSIAEKTEVDAAVYTSWISGVLILKGETMSTITQRLAQYHAVEIHCAPSIQDKKVYGKLDLKDNLIDILESIQGAVSFQIKENNNNKIYLSE